MDSVDYEEVSKYAWHVCDTKDSRTHYAGNNNLGLLHRFLLNARPDEQVDHINGNGLDNRRINLRLCSNEQNQYNRPVPSNNSSGYKGVSFHKHTKKWRATIGYEGKHKHIGYFDSVEEAAKAYDSAAIELYGEFARLNFPKETK